MRAGGVVQVVECLLATQNECSNEQNRRGWIFRKKGSGKQNQQMKR
jgi:hypothetical protein